MQTSSATGRNGSPEGARSSKSASKIDFWAVLDLLVSRWGWLAIGLVIGGVAAGVVGVKFVHPKYTATAQLLRYATPGAGDLFNRETPMSSETFGGLMQAPELLQSVGEMASPPIPPDKFAKQLKVDPDEESDLVNVSLAADSPQQAVDLLNCYLTNVVEYLRDLQARDVRGAANAYLDKEVGQMDRDIAALDKEFQTLALPPAITNKVAQIGGQLNQLSNNLTASARPMVVSMQTERLNQAVGDLADLLSKYTEIHPLVRQKEEEVKALRAAIAAQPANTATPVAEPAAPVAQPVQPPAQTFNPEFDIIRTKLLSLEEGRVQMVNRLREAELYAANPPGAARAFAPASLKTVHASLRSVKIAVAALVGALLGLTGSLFVVVLIEFADSRLKTADDVSRVTKLPVLTTLGDVGNMDAEAKAQWAFRTWTMLQGRLSPSTRHGFVCGFTSSSEGEGRSTWIRLLAEAASLTGFRVLTVATQPSTAGGKPDASSLCELLPDALQVKDPADILVPQKANVLAQPDQVANQLTAPNSEPVVHIPLPGWVWNRERREQWHEALNYWRKIENLVILVELPPADVPETVLLGSSLPNLIWVSDSSVAEAASARDQLETLRDARCNLVGAVMNRETKTPLKRRFPRWIGCVLILGALSGFNARAQDTNFPAALSSTNLSFSIVHPSQRAAWQEHLTLGAGDILNFGLFGQPEFSLTDVAIAPDGRVSFLEARDVMAAGLTVDELRARLDDELSKYRRAPHTLVTPVAFRSKKYYMLGKVMVKGAYVLDRPLTVLEAIARAKGFENGLVNRSVVDLADFSRSFVARNGKRIPLNFETLFEAGDLSQNLAVEPGDCVYIAGANVQEVYVVGEVRLAGPVNYSPGETVVAAITARGGFTDRAYQGRVLVVRGSLNHPEPFVVNTGAILGGETRDFTLEPRDIIYVSHRPFIRVEELTDLATTAFIQGLITAWVGVKLVKPFNQ